MILLTRLGGHALAVNPDLIERAEATPDTVLTMIGGHKIMVSESVEDVVERLCAWRARVTAQAYALSRHLQPEDVLPHPGTLPDTDELGDHAAMEASLARVLRMPQRGE